MVHDLWFMINTDLQKRIQKFIEFEGKSCSFDPELITPLYVYRMWGGKFSMEDIENGLMELRGTEGQVHVSLMIEVI